ncbi:MAG: hypothetical protein K5799_05880 [Erythrobacter sp.]|nr:hypothetical protein [Erythrobacter sp.]
MGLAILLLAGAALGWAGAIVLEREHRLCVLICICTGAVGALLGGALSGSSASLLWAISPAQLLWAVIGAGVAFALSQAVVRAVSEDLLD